MSIVKEPKYIKIEHRELEDNKIEFSITEQSHIGSKFAESSVYKTTRSEWHLCSISCPAIDRVSKRLFLRGTSQACDNNKLYIYKHDFEEIKKAIDAYNEEYSNVNIPEYNSKVYCKTKRNNIKQVRYNKTNMKKYKVLATEIDDLL